MWRFEETPVSNVTISDFLQGASRRWPHHTAYVYASLRTTWAQTEARVAALAAGLRARGIGPGDVVATCTSDGPVLVETIFAVARLGAVRVGINYRLSQAEVGRLLAHCSAKLVLVQHEQLDLVADVAASLQVLDVGDAQTDQGAYAELLASPPLTDVPTVDDASLAQICYTTGSTGKPKGALWSHRAMAHAMGHTLLELGFQRDEIWLHCFPAAGVPCLFTLWNSLQGFTSVIMPRFDPAAALDLIEAHGVTRVILVPTMLSAMCVEQESRARVVSSLRCISYGSASTPPALVRRAARNFPGVDLEQWYGSTEGVGGWFAQLSCADHARALAGEDWLLSTCGRAMHHARIRVVDEQDRDCQPGEVGEVCISGAFLMSGYHREPELSAETLRGGWLHTGDMGHLNPDGYLSLVDRKQFMIITGGYNVYPVEIENVLAEHPAVLESCVFGVPDDKWGEAVHALVVLRAGESASVEDIAGWCRGKLAKFKVPKAVEFRAALLRGATGKILKRAERDHYWPKA
jgi:acyl-CoA synthetase (AMP-forming)/AMP-acid ligase II